jgi:hypothetical protein
MIMPLIIAGGWCTRSLKPPKGPPSYSIHSHGARGSQRRAIDREWAMSSGVTMTGPRDDDGVVHVATTFFLPEMS